MTDTKKLRLCGVPREQEDALENVSGGMDFKKPLFGHDPLPDRTLCPVCRQSISIDIFAERVQCPGCGRWFRVEGSALKEE